MSEQFRVGFAPGVTPDKWARAWAARMPRRPLDLEPLRDRDGVALLRSGDLQMCFVRLPVDADGLRLIPLYEEQPVVVVSRDNPVAAYPEIDVTDLADEHLLQDPDEVPAWRDVATEVRDGTRHPVPPMTMPQAVETVASGTGILVLPLSVARLHHRKDVTHVLVTGVPTSSVGLAWPAAGGDADGEPEDDRVDTFIGVVRGRTANTSRDARASQAAAQPRKVARSDPSPKASRGATPRRAGTPAGKPRRKPRR